jgi:CheY-like chemotaxis protein
VHALPETARVTIPARGRRTSPVSTQREPEKPSRSSGSGLRRRPTSRNPTGPRALIVEDHDDVREIFAAHMRAAGWVVEAVANGQEALFVAPAFAPDVVVMDVRMPVLGGLEATRRLKKDPRTRNVPVVVCSAHPLEAEARTAGCDEYVVKPCAPDALQTLLQTLVARRNGSAT